MQNSKIVILDSGFWQMKIGFAGDEAPRYEDRNLIGEEDREYYIGNDALINKKLLNIQYPLSSQNECQFQNFEKIWHELFYNKMKIDIQDFPVFLTLSAFFEEKRKVEVCELLFENFDVPAIYSSISNVTGLYGEGKTSGLVVDSGFVGTYVLNVFEGYPVEDNTCYNLKGGNLLGQQMKEKVVQNLNQDSELQRIQNKFHKLYGYTFDVDYFDNLKPYCFSSTKDNIELLLPDENRVKVNQNIFDELKLQNFQNFANSIQEVLNNTEEEYIDDFKSKIFLQGGNTLFPNTEQEVLKILKQNEMDDIKIYQRTDDEKIYNSWIGASLFASLSSFSDIWVTKQDYMEYGHYAILDRNLIQFFQIKTFLQFYETVVKGLLLKFQVSYFPNKFVSFQYFYFNQPSSDFSNGFYIYSSLLSQKEFPKELPQGFFTVVYRFTNIITASKQNIIPSSIINPVFPESYLTFLDISYPYSAYYLASQISVLTQSKVIPFLVIFYKIIQLLSQAIQLLSFKLFTFYLKVFSLYFSLNQSVRFSFNNRVKFSPLFYSQNLSVL